MTEKHAGADNRAKSAQAGEQGADHESVSEVTNEPITASVSEITSVREAADVSEVTRAPAPTRSAQLDFFVADILDVSPKDDQFSMEHPVFSISKRRDTSIFRYEHRDVMVEVVPSALGRATQTDKDILIYCASHVVEAANKGRPTGPVVQLTPHDLLVTCQRGTGGRSYELLLEALKRLSGTRLTTQIKGKSGRTAKGSGLINDWEIVEKGPDGGLGAIRIELADWFYKSLLGKEVLTLNPAYFQLTSPLDRRLYELARKHCGKQKSWRVGLAVLHKKTGAQSSLREFKRKLTQRACILDYNVDLVADEVLFTPREAEPNSSS